MAPDHSPDVRSVTPAVAVVLPVRDEEACLERCLRSLVTQEGVPYEVIVVDDHSTDRTPEIIKKFRDVQDCPFIGPKSSLVNFRALNAPTLPPGWTGKSNAVWAGVQESKAEWLLFTDADTVHLPGSLARAVTEAEEHHAVLLSYSPHQEIETFTERVLMPVVFSELACQYPPKLVSDPESECAAANGQYLLVRRDIYFAIGGHRAISGSILEDVALARRVKRSSGRIRFRYGGDQVSTRMYRSWQQLRDGWTKNLALLFPRPRSLASARAAEAVSLLLAFMAVMIASASGRFTASMVALALTLALWIRIFARLRRAHAGLLNEALGVLGLPVFAWLLVRSAKAHESGRVTWKDRTYAPAESEQPVSASLAKAELSNNQRTGSSGPSH